MRSKTAGSVTSFNNVWTTAFTNHTALGLRKQLNSGCPPLIKRIPKQGYHVVNFRYLQIEGMQVEIVVRKLPPSGCCWVSCLFRGRVTMLCTSLLSSRVAIFYRARERATTPHRSTNWPNMQGWQEEGKLNDVICFYEQPRGSHIE